MVKPRILVSHVSHSSSRWSERSSITTALSNPENPGKALTKMPDVDRSSGKPFEHDCDTSDNVKHSQVRKQEMFRAQKPGNKQGLLPLTAASGNGQAMQ